MGDVIIGIDRVVVAATDDLMRLLDFGRIGRAIEVSVLRGGQTMMLSVIPGERS